MRRLPVFVGLLALLSSVAAPAYAVPLDATAPVQVSGATPFDPSCGLEPAGGTVFLDSEVEPYVDVNPTDPDNIVGMWQQDRWSNGGARGNVAGVSFDGGSTWSLVPLPGVSECTGGEFDRASDPWVSFGPDGTLYAMHLVTDAAPPPNKPGGFGHNGMMVQRSMDGGLTWEPPILIAEEDDGDGLHDKNTLTADPTRAGFAYAVWDFLDVPAGGTINPDRGTFGGGLGFKGGSLISRTTDGGVTWSAPKRLYNPGGVNQTIGNQIVVRPDGTLVNVFNEILNFRNDDRDAQFDFNLALKFSPDAGQTWLPKGPPIRFGDMLPRTLFNPVFPFVSVYQPDADGAETVAGANAVRSGEVIPEVAVDPNNGNLYVVWMDARFTLPGATSVTQIIDEIAFTMSTDGGFSWSTPIKVNQTPENIRLGNRQAFTPMVRVLDDGTVGVSYYDFRNNVDDDGVGTTDLFVAHCHPASQDCTDPSSWGEETRVTTSSFDITEAPFANGFFLGDYVGFETDGADFVSLFTQSGVGGDPASEYFSRIGP